MSPYLRLAYATFAMLLFAIPASGQTADPALKALIYGPQRSEKNRARDPYRHPAEALTFFGVTPHSVVVEILPGAGGYWTEILAPYLKAKGRYIAANGEKDSTSEETRKDNAGFEAKLAADPTGYGKVEITEFAADRHEIAPAGSAFTSAVTGIAMGRKPFALRASRRPWTTPMKSTAPWPAASSAPSAAPPRPPTAPRKRLVSAGMSLPAAAIPIGILAASFLPWQWRARRRAVP